MKAILTSGGVLRISVALVVVVGLLGGLVVFLSGGSRTATAGGDHKGEDGVDSEQTEIPVKIVRPHYDKTFTMIEKRPADVRPYFVASLKTMVPGRISWLPYDVGAVVKKNERLVEVEVPDLVAREKQRQAAWELARAQVEQKEAAIKTAEADHKAAKAQAQAYRARLASDVAYQKFRDKQAIRYRGLLADRAIDARLVDEQEDRLQASIEAVTAAREAVEKADAQVEASDARITQARADRDEAKQNVAVTKAEHDYAQAMLDYATIRAPFDGEIVRRNVDPGHFVQNASDGQTTPLLIIQRQDIVTVVVRVPDNFAPYITPNTEAIFETPSLPGVKIHGKVTRYPTSLVNPEKDRTMLVEIDLWNKSKEKFNRIMNSKKDSEEFRNNLKTGLPGVKDGNLPIVPQIEGAPTGGQQLRLMPGMFGQVTLVLRKFEDAYMLPSASIVITGGNQYVYVVQGGKAHLQPVKMQVDDGKLVKVELLDDNGDVLGDLTGKEEVIVSNQGELSEGQAVKPVLVEDWKSLAPESEKKEKH